jgi:hypothetical protein
MNDEAFRKVAAASMAQGFVVEILLTQYLKAFPAGDSRTSICDTIIRTAQRTDHYAGLTKDEHTAELFADVVVRMHGAIEQLVSRAAARIAA